MLNAEEQGIWQALCDTGLNLKHAWLRQALRAPPSGRTAGLSAEARAYQLALLSDFHEAALGCLPQNVAAQETSVVKGKFVLQVDEIVDVSQAAEHRQGVINNRTLKMLLTDGKQTIVGVEKKRLDELSVLSCAGLKIVVSDFTVRRGIAHLRPENCCVLGGMEAELERQRLKRIAEQERSRKRTQIVADAGRTVQNLDFL